MLSGTSTCASVLRVTILSVLVASAAAGQSSTPPGAGSSSAPAAKSPAPPPPPSPPSLPSSSPQPSPLAGPTVSTPAVRLTLVEQDFPGKIRRLDVSPEEAAVRLLELPADVKAKVESVLNERVRKLDAFVAENLLLLNQLDTAGKAGDTLDQVTLLAEAVQKLAPVWSKGTIKSQLRAVLPDEARVEFDRLVNEYWDAIVSEHQKAPAAASATGNDMMMSPGEATTAGKPAAKSKAGAKTKAKAASPKPKGRFAIVTEERLASFGKEIERAFERQTQSGDILASYIFQYVTVNAEQKARIRELCAEFAEKTKGNASEAQNQELFVKIAGALDLEQQKELAKLIQGRKKTPEKPEKKDR